MHDCQCVAESHCLDGLETPDMVSVRELLIQVGDLAVEDIQMDASTAGSHYFDVDMIGSECSEVIAG